jgi:hypothetical protein
VDASRVLFFGLLMLTALWVKPIWAQVGSKPTDSAADANVTDINVSGDWAKKDVKFPKVVSLWSDEAILDLLKAELRIGDVRDETSISVAHPLMIVGSPFRWYRNALFQQGYV